MWVEPDLHAPSGESVLRQFAHGIRWMRDNVGVEPTVAWLPDTFGFPSTFPIARGARGRAVLRDDQAAVERDDALAVPALPLDRRRRLGARRPR